MASLLKQVSLLVLTPKCYDTFFLDFNFFHVECLKAAISKSLGFALVLGSIFVKLPQILKINAAKSADGISLTGVSLELAALLASVSYNFVNQYPFSAYGDGAFLLLQTSIIGSLVFHYGGNTQKAVLFLLTMSLSTMTLCSGVVPLSVLWMLQAANIPVVFAGKMAQAYANYQNGSTGQLSAITLTLLFFGSMARIFTSIQETGDKVIIITYFVSTIANGILMGQLLFYWDTKTSKDKKEQ